MYWLQEFLPLGRLSRGGFWLRHLSCVPLGVWLANVTADSLGRPYDVLVAAAMIGLLISIWGRRLHDRGRSAWWLLLALVPVAGLVLLGFECALRGTSLRARRFGAPRGERFFALTVMDVGSWQWQ